MNVFSYHFNNIKRHTVWKSKVKWSVLQMTWQYTYKTLRNNIKVTIIFKWIHLSRPQNLKYAKTVPIYKTKLFLYTKKQLEKYNKKQVIYKAKKHKILWYKLTKNMYSHARLLWDSIPPNLVSQLHWTD
jgi:hypothetical protein